MAGMSERLERSVVGRDEKNGGVAHWAARLRVRLLVGLMKTGARRRTAWIDGLMLRLGDGVCNPAPLRGLSIAELYRSALSDVDTQTSFLDIGTGSGVWALMAVRLGADVTATDLPGTPLDLVAENAWANGLYPPTLLAGDLFEPVAGQRFDRIVFNAPFHDGVPKRAEERAYLGGAGGSVFRRFLQALPGHLSEDGSACVILPRTEWTLYEDSLSHFSVEVRAKKWVPLLGMIYCLELRAAS